MENMENLGLGVQKQTVYNWFKKLTKKIMGKIYVNINI